MTDELDGWQNAKEKERQTGYCKTRIRGRLGRNLSRWRRSAWRKDVADKSKHSQQNDQYHQFLTAILHKKHCAGRPSVCQCVLPNSIV
jgi:hypothetical protein